MRLIIQEIIAFVLTTAGWALVCSTMPTDIWKIATLEGIVLGTALITSNLWKNCVGDSTGVTDCKDFPSMLSLDADIQICRALMITAIILCFFASIFALFGMQCTKIGGTVKTKAITACIAGVTFILSGLCSISAYSLYAHRITTEYFDPKFIGFKYDFGVALFVGWGGSVLCIAGGCIFCFSITNSFTKSKSQENYISKDAASYSHVSLNTAGKAKSTTQGLPTVYINPSSIHSINKNSYI